VQQAILLDVARALENQQFLAGFREYVFSRYVRDNARLKFNHNREVLCEGLGEPGEHKTAHVQVG